MIEKRISGALSLVALLCAWASAQTTTGSLLGTVTDSSNAAVPGVQVELKHLTTGSVRTTTSGPEGIFRFNSLEPAEYDLTVKPTSGFKTYTQKAIHITPNENRDLGRIELALGSLAEEVSVTAAVTPVQTASSENSKLVDSSQISNITLKGRDMMAVLQTMPGLNFGDTYLTGGGGDTINMLTGLYGLTVNGVTSSNWDAKVNFQVDGITDMDTGSDAGSAYQPSVDAIAEMRVLTTNYQAEYGRNSAGQISVVTKGGGQEFHGGAFANKRHEMFNAKNFFQNYNGQQKSLYRFFVWGYSVGGPVALPKLPAMLKKKVFFFVSQELTRTQPATDTAYAMTPTVAQRAGNFAGYSDGNGKPYSLRDPTTGNPVPNNNLVPYLGSVGNTQSAAYGQAMLNFFPLPNLCNAASGAVAPSGCITDPDPTQNYKRNYVSTFNESHPLRNDTIRIDWNITSKITSWFRYINYYDNQNAGGSIALKNGLGQWAPYSSDYPRPGHGYGVGLTYTISPTMVNEFTFGKNWSSYNTYAHDASQLARVNMNTPPSFNDFTTDPKFINDQHLWMPAGMPPGSENFQIGIPSVSFGGGQEPSEVSWSNSNPYTNWENLYSFNDALSKTWRAHNLKAGVYFEENWKWSQQGQGSYLGNYSFSSGAAMPSDVQDGFANAYLGNFNTYSEGARVMGNWWMLTAEMFMQDNWRISRRLTLDLGIRFTHDPPIENVNLKGMPPGWGASAVWVRSTYDPAAAERLYYPGCAVSTATAPCPTASQYAIDSVTGYKTYYALAGTFVPASVGAYSSSPTPFPGMQVATGDNPLLPISLYKTAALAPAPRFGFAWDVFGTGKTAIRGGVGVFLNRGSDDQVLSYVGQPPVTYNRAIYYSTVNQVPTFANSAAITPFAPGETLGEQKLEGTYNGSVMVQQKVGFATVMEAAYVFNLRRHIPDSRQLNAIPIFGQYSPSWASPMTGYLYANASGKDLSDNYFRPIRGMGAMTAQYFEASSDYHALQMNVRRNMTRRLSYGLAYTFSKIMSGSPSPYWPDKYRNWGPSYTPVPHVITINYVYEAPNIGQKLNLKPLGWVTDHWTISGMTQWRSDRKAGVPGISFTGSSSTNPTPNFTGSAEGARMIVTGDPSLPAGQASFVGGAAKAGSNGGYGPNGTPGNQLLNEGAFMIPYPCSYTPASTPQMGVGETMECFGNAGPGSIVTIPNTTVNNWDVTFAKNFPLKSEKRIIMFRAEMYNIFNHAQFNGWNITPTYDWNNWKNGALVQTNSQLGRYTSALNPRQMSMSLRFQF